MRSTHTLIFYKYMSKPQGRGTIKVDVFSTNVGKTHTFIVPRPCGQNDEDTNNWGAKELSLFEHIVYALPDSKSICEIMFKFRVNVNRQKCLKTTNFSKSRSKNLLKIWFVLFWSIDWLKMYFEFYWR